jgi:HD superfamily phosphohydrolase
VNGQLVVEAKGIYSIEKFLIARRLMYWQVYYHKTVIAAENLLVKLLKRAKETAASDPRLFATNSLNYFLKQNVGKKELETLRQEVLHHFANLDDDDIMASAKSWMTHSDRLLSTMSGNLTRRILPRVKISDEPFIENRLDELRHAACQQYQLNRQEADYLVFSGLISNKAYSEKSDTIRIWYNTGEIKDLSEASDIFHLQNLMETRKKYFLCYPKDLGFNY